MILSLYYTVYCQYSFCLAVRLTDQFLLILIFSLNILVLKAGEINFDVTEIEILEEGNLIKGYDGGKAITDNNIIIM